METWHIWPLKLKRRVSPHTSCNELTAREMHSTHGNDAWLGTGSVRAGVTVTVLRAKMSQEAHTLGGRRFPLIYREGWSGRSWGPPEAEKHPPSALNLTLSRTRVNIQIMILLASFKKEMSSHYRLQYLPRKNEYMKPLLPTRRSGSRRKTPSE